MKIISSTCLKCMPFSHLHEKNVCLAAKYQDFGTHMYKCDSICCEYIYIYIYIYKLIHRDCRKMQISMSKFEQSFVDQGIKLSLAELIFHPITRLVLH